MIPKCRPFYLPMVSIIFVVVSACEHSDGVAPSIALNGFSDRNYGPLNDNIGNYVCVNGVISIGPNEIYFPLRPIEDDEVMDIGFSRIILPIDRSYVERDGITSGKRYRVCGTLQDATPFQQCDNNYCRWYRLNGAELAYWSGGERPR